MSDILLDCADLLDAYHRGELGQTVMPEDSNPGFTKKKTEIKLVYFSLPMALNYQRNSYDLWKAALKTYEDKETGDVFNILSVSKMSEDKLRKSLTKYKLALQPNKHIEIWQKISKTVVDNWGSFTKLLVNTEYDFMELRKILQKDYKKGFPYLSGPKIFHYWCYILNIYCDVNLRNSESIDIAPDTHITRCSVRLGIITKKESKSFSKEQISERWRNVLNGSGINPIDMHAPLWFWSRNGFIYSLHNK